MALKQTKKRSAPNGNGASHRFFPVSRGALALFGVITCLSLAAGFHLGSTSAVYVEGEVASRDVNAWQDLLIEDEESTEQKRQALLDDFQPVYDLSDAPYAALEASTKKVLSNVEAVPHGELEQGRWEISEEFDTEISRLTYGLWRNAEFVEIFHERILPLLRQMYSRGVVRDLRVLRAESDGFVVRNLNTGVETVHTDSTAFLDVESVKNLLDDAMQQEMNLKLRSRRAVRELVTPFLSPNLLLDQEETQRRKNHLLERVEPVYSQVRRGEIIVRKGERVTKAQQQTLQAMYTDPSGWFQPLPAFGFLILSGFLGVGFLYFGKRREKGRHLTRDDLLMALLLLIFGGAAKGLHLALEVTPATTFGFDTGLLAFGLPVAGAVGLMSFFYTRPMCILGCFLLSFACTALVGGGLALFLMYFLTGTVFMLLLQETRNRVELLKTFFPLAGSTIMVWCGLAFADQTLTSGFGTGLGASVVGAGLSLMVLLSFSPVFEHLLGYTSRFRLMELMNLEQPLLQELMVRAPGTYHHSLIVANLVEAGARTIGADGTLAKTAALYHDIGKLKNPEYFIENQFGGKNKHDKLAPSMSALILTNHVKKGVEMAEQHRLGPEIIDIIRQHHGCGLIRYFYAKAQEAVQTKGEGAVREEDFRYPGPKPQSREAALLLLADIVEASSRTLSDPTSSRIRGHIKSMVNMVFKEEQLDETDLTLRDLNKLVEAFHRILTGIFHQRVAYPGADRPEVGDAVS